MFWYKVLREKYEITVGNHYLVKYVVLIFFALDHNFHENNFTLVLHKHAVTSPNTLIFLT